MTSTAAQADRAPYPEQDPVGAHHRRRRLSESAAFWVVASAFATVMAFGTVPTPLWPLYEARDHFGPTTVTTAFAAMVVGAAAAFSTLGHLSDRVGRRRVMVSALLTTCLAAAVMAAAPALPSLIAGRLLVGAAVGLMASTATAYLTDLHQAAHGHRTESRTPGLVATAANLGGLSLGPLAAGALAEWVPGPLTTPYVLFSLLAAALALLVSGCPETVAHVTRKGSHSRRFALRPGQGAAFAAAAAVGFFAFAVMGLFSALGAIIVRAQLGITSTFVVGLVPFATLAASAAGQFVLGRLSSRGQFVTGITVFPVGLALTAVTLYRPALWLALTAACFAGGGAGLLFKGAVTQSAAAAAPDSRAGVLAVFFVTAYLGMGLPNIAFSILIQHLALRPSMIGFTSALAAGAGLAVTVAVRAERSTLRA